MTVKAFGFLIRPHFLKTLYRQTQLRRRVNCSVLSSWASVMQRAPLLPLLLLSLARLTGGSNLVTYKLQHAFGITGAFQDRGSVEVLVDSGALTLIPPPEEQRVLVPEASLDEIAREMKGFNGGMYRLRAQESDGVSSPVVMTSVHLCDVVRAGFRENITLTLDVEGRLIGLEYTPRMSRLSPSTCKNIKHPLDQYHARVAEEVGRRTPGDKEDSVSSPPAFMTWVKASVDDSGKSVPVLVPGQRPPLIAIRQEDQGGQPEAPKSFLQKYVGNGGRAVRERGGGGETLTCRLSYAGGHREGVDVLSFTSPHF